ncbi:hypothetical protein [Marinifilum fragile]|uniref:hypothetical protein n=1 Tax=Marinifilum fragile TaxID=570161 RepID=UPI002AABAC0D|nr:hypothetical protein [Marinifilum fragile]
MKLNYNNKIIKYAFFRELSEAKTFFINQKSRNKIFLDDTFGENHIVVNSFNSLTGEIYLSIGFCSERSINELNLLLWEEENKWIIEIDDCIYMISSLSAEIVTKFEVSTPLVGFYAAKNRLLVLEEANIKVLNSEGDVLQEKAIDLIDNYSLTDDGILNITTIEGEESQINLFKNN